MVFTIPAPALHDSIYTYYPGIVPFYTLFNEQIIRIGPDSLPGYSANLQEFTSDSMIKGLYASINRDNAPFENLLSDIRSAFERWRTVTGNPAPGLVTFISGFNQSFITLPGILGIGLDRYLGGESPFYKGLDIPVYIRNTMNPENLPGDAVRAWLYSELPPPPEGSSFLDQMVYEGKIHYLAGELLGDHNAERLFHFTSDQVAWCISHEAAMWKYLAEQQILFSTDRLTVRKFLEDAPFTKDFGNDSPGRTGIWIGYRVIGSYMKANKLDTKTLAGLSDARKILSGSKYHP
jgi:hypothetical protein